MEPLRTDSSVGQKSQAAQLREILLNGHPGLAYVHADGDKPAIQVNRSELQHLIEALTLGQLRQQVWTLECVEDAVTPGLFRAVTATFWMLTSFDPAGYSVSPRPVPVEPPVIGFELAQNIADWIFPWTPREYSRTLHEIITARQVPDLGHREFGDHNLQLSFGCRARSLEHTLRVEVDHWMEIIREIHEEAIAHLLAAHHADSLTTTFHFPPAIATACEQYLLYFVQFLADLGIEAQAEVKHDAAEVLFRVTPAEGREALERVREALDAYLSLPTDPSLALVPSAGQDPAVWELKAVVRHLRDRLELQQDVLEAKNATIAAQAHSIEALELSNFRLRQISGGEVQPVARSGSATAGEDDSEPIIPRAVSLKRYEIGPIVVEIPEIVRMLKRRFGKDT